MNSPHLSAPAEIAATMRLRAEETRPSFDPTIVALANFPLVSVQGHDGDPSLTGMLMRACGHVILYHRDLPVERQRVKIAHAIGHLILDDKHRDAACTHRPEEEEWCDEFEGVLLVPFEALIPHVYRWPGSERHEIEMYRDQIDRIAQHFVVPTQMIHQRILDLQAAFRDGFRI